MNSPGGLIFQRSFGAEIIREGELFRRGGYFFNVAFAFLTQRNSDRIVANFRTKPLRSSKNGSVRVIKPRGGRGELVAEIWYDG